MNGSNKEGNSKANRLGEAASVLRPYAKDWTRDQAAHLLRRTIFGPTLEQIESSTNLGLEATLELLFQKLTEPPPPINFYDERDAYVPLGETWIEAPYGKKHVEHHLEARLRSLKAWNINLLFEEGISIREKLTLFWHNHFAVGDIEDPKYVYQYISTLRQEAWGSFKQLVKKITLNPAMLRFLNGYQNTAKAPNENFARELLELYTIGKGDLVAPGDYSNYTEDDVLQIARILTGWQDTGYKTTSRRVKVGAVFQSDLHDKGSKELSHCFHNTCISDMGKREYAYLIDVIFQQREVARFICRKLYRWFVYYVIDEQIESEVIEPMAQILIDHDFEIKPALLALLRSAHFFDHNHVGAMIKNPFDFFMSIAKTTKIPLPEDIYLRYRLLIPVNTTMELMQMDYFNPPSVAGWRAYHQEPLYYRNWINAANLSVRAEAADRLAVVGQNLFGFYLKIDVLGFVNVLEKPHDPDQLLDEICFIFFPKPIPIWQRNVLKSTLVSDLPDYEWTAEYNKYLANPQDEPLKQAIEMKLRLLFKKIISIPEFNLS